MAAPDKAPKTRKNPNPAGMGGVYKDNARGGYVAQVCVGVKPNGKPHYVRRRARTHAEASAALMDLQVAHKTGNLATVGRKTTLGEWLDRWLEIVRPELAPGTVRFYESTIRLHIKPALGPKPLHAVGAAEIEALCARLKATGKRRYPTAVFVTLRTAYKRAVKLGLVPKSPVDAAAPPKSAPREEKFLTSAQVAAFLDALADEPAEVRALGTVGILTGLRLGELLGLTWDGIDLEGGLGFVRSQLRRVPAVPKVDEEGKRRPAGYALADLKTTKSRRTVPLSPACVEALRMEQSRQLLEEPANPLRLALLNPEGRPWDQKTANNRLKAVCRRAGLPPYSAHVLFRHSYATLMLKSGVSLHDASRTLGHSTPNLTGALYGHHEAEAARRVGATVDLALERASGNRPRLKSD